VPPIAASLQFRDQKTRGFYLSLPVIAGAARALEEMLEAGHEVFVCTSPLSGTRWCMQEKLVWVEEHLGASWVDRVIITKGCRPGS